MGDAGTEHARQYSKFGGSPKCAAEIQAVADDPQLSVVLAAWPTLPVAARSEIVRLVEATSTKADKP
jgi:hypothetical protein